MSQATFNPLHSYAVHLYGRHVIAICEGKRMTPMIQSEQYTSTSCLRANMVVLQQESRKQNQQ
eukprot:scaffold32746_cov35-Prasinocladus_malaysianus.AAC.2